MSTSSPSSRYTAQCNAVAPSTWGALTSAFCWINVRIAARSPFDAASATGLLVAAVAAPAEHRSARVAYPRTWRMLIVNSALNETGQRSGTVALLRPFDPVHVEQADEHVSRGHRLPFELEHPA